MKDLKLFQQQSEPFPLQTNLVVGLHVPSLSDQNNKHTLVHTIRTASLHQRSIPFKVSIRAPLSTRCSLSQYWTKFQVGIVKWQCNQTHSRTICIHSSNKITQSLSEVHAAEKYLWDRSECTLPDDSPALYCVPTMGSCHIMHAPLHPQSDSS